MSKIRSEAPGRPVLAQEFLPEISDGEWKITCIGGKVEMAIRSVPPAGEFRISSRFGPEILLLEPPAPARSCAERIMELVGLPLCGRVDGVMRNDVFICTEVELTDPDLHLHLSPGVADILARSTMSRVAKELSGA